jgi:hypothetical protein
VVKVGTPRLLHAQFTVEVLGAARSAGQLAAGGGAPPGDGDVCRHTVPRLNALFEIVVPAVVDAGGHVNKFLGDGGLAVFGAPNDLAEHAGAAVSAAVLIHRRVAERFGGARNPCSRRTAPPTGHVEQHCPTTEEVWALHDAVPEHLKVAVLLGAFAGNVDFLRGVVHPKQQWPTKPLKTEGSEQPIPIPRDLALLLSAEVQKYPSEMMVTNGPGTDRCGPWIIERAIRDAREKIDGLPEAFTFHDLRHYLASLLIASGADIKTVQARMRHATARTTLDTYGHLWSDADESTRTAIGAVIKQRIIEKEERVPLDCQ